MKKLLLSFLIVSMLFVCSPIKAQTYQMTEETRQQLIITITNLIAQLQAQINEMLAQQNIVEPQIINTPIVEQKIINPINNMELSLQSNPIDFNNSFLKTNYSLSELQGDSINIKIFVLNDEKENIFQKNFQSILNVKETFNGQTKDSSYPSSGTYEKKFGFYHNYRIINPEVGIYNILFNMPEFNLNKEININVEK